VRVAGRARQRRHDAAHRLPPARGHVALSGCASIGPATVRWDQVDCADAVSEAAKRQLLPNLVKLRYGDTRPPACR
jgi:hypothetical protein